MELAFCPDSPFDRFGLASFFCVVGLTLSGQVTGIYDDDDDDTGI